MIESSNERPPFQGALVLALQGNRYVKVQANRYATTNDLGHCRHLGASALWNDDLDRGFAFTEVRLLEVLRGLGLMPGLPKPTSRSIRSTPMLHAFPGATGRPSWAAYSQPCQAVTWSNRCFFPDGGRTSPLECHLYPLLRHGWPRPGNRPGPPLDITLVRTSVFQNIDRLLATRRQRRHPEGGRSARGAGCHLPSSLVDTATRVRYLEALVKAWTEEPQEKGHRRDLQERGRTGASWTS